MLNNCLSRTRLVRGSFAKKSARTRQSFLHRIMSSKHFRKPMQVPDCSSPPLTLLLPGLRRC